MGDYRYLNLSNLLYICYPSQQVVLTVRQVKHIKTNFRSGLYPDGVSSLIGAHFNSVLNCCEQSNFEPSLLNKAKCCTREKSMGHKYSEYLKLQ